MEARLHSEDRRLTLVFCGRDFLVFRISDFSLLENLTEALLIMEHPPAADARFAYLEGDEECAYLICNLHQRELDMRKKSSTSFSLFSLDLIDLDQDQ